MLFLMTISTQILILQDPRKLSLIELCLIRLSAYGKSLKNQIRIGMDHIMGKVCSSSTHTQDENDSCPLCFARGFICEFCRSEEIIFPFQSALEVII